MSTNKMREVLEQAHDLSLDGRHEEARAAILEALADDDAARGTMPRPSLQLSVFDESGVGADDVVWDAMYEYGQACAQWQASRAAAPQSVEPVAGAVWNGKEVMLVRLGEEDSYLRKGCSRLHLAPPSAPTDAEWEAKRAPDDILLRAGLDAYNAAQGTAIDRVAAAIRAVLSTRPAQAEELIACSERLPNPDSGEVLVWLWESKMYAIDEWHTHSEDPTGMGGPTLDMGLMWRNFDFDEVSHWRPLPAPPTKTKEPGA